MTKRGETYEIRIHHYECTIVGPTEECTCEPHIQRLARLHEAMQRVNRLVNLYRTIVVIPRSRLNPSGGIAPVIDVVATAKITAAQLASE